MLKKFIDSLNVRSHTGKLYTHGMGYNQYWLHFHVRKTLDKQFSFVMTVSGKSLQGTAFGFTTFKNEAHDKIMEFINIGIQDINNNQNELEGIGFKRLDEGYLSGNIWLNIKNFRMYADESAICIGFKGEKTYRLVKSPFINISTIIKSIPTFMNPMEFFSLSNETRDLIILKS